MSTTIGDGRAVAVRDAVRSPLCVTANVLMAAGFAVVALAAPSLAAYTRFPRWALITTAVACLFIAPKMVLFPVAADGPPETA